MAKFVPVYTGTLRNHSLTLPACISDCSGIRIFGRRIKSLAFSTDDAVAVLHSADRAVAALLGGAHVGVDQLALRILEIGRAHV